MYKGGGKGMQGLKGGVEGGRCIAVTNSYKVSHGITLLLEFQRLEGTHTHDGA